jgi:hypothetical protein
MPDERPPVPDPTVLTTEQLLREITTLKELMNVTLGGYEAVCLEKFASVKDQLGHFERQRIEQKKDTKDAVDAALAAAKEAVKEQTIASQLSIGKSEGSTKEQLGQLSTTFTTAQRASSDALAGLTTRVERIENARTALAEQKTDTRAGTGTLIAVGALVIGLLSFVMTLILTVTRL